GHWRLPSDPAGGPARVRPRLRRADIQRRNVRRPAGRSYYEGGRAAPPGATGIAGRVRPWWNDDTTLGGFADGFRDRRPCAARGPARPADRDPGRPVGPARPDSAVARPLPPATRHGHRGGCAGLIGDST